MTENLSERVVEPELSKEAITHRLFSIANANIKDVTHKNALKHFMSHNNVMDTFRAGIGEFGQQDAWQTLLTKGVDSDYSHYFYASFFEPPAAKSGPIVHIYATDGGIPTYGIFLPFTENGILDYTRQISGTTFASDRLHIYHPFSCSLTEEKSARTIAWATQMAAAQLASILERKDPEALPEPEIEIMVEPQSRLKRIFSHLGRIAHFPRSGQLVEQTTEA